MTLNHDHATLFVSPAQPAGTEPADGEQPAVDHRAETMLRLRHPFAVPGVSPAPPGR